MEGRIQGGRKMNTNITAMLDELRELKQKQMNISSELANEVMKYPGVQEALKDGLIRLNFPAPAGFLRYLKNNYK